MNRPELIANGRCCGNGCNECPYDPIHTKGAEKIACCGAYDSDYCECLKEKI